MPGWPTNAGISRRRRPARSAAPPRRLASSRFISRRATWVARRNCDGNWNSLSGAAAARDRGPGTHSGLGGFLPWTVGNRSEGDLAEPRKRKIMGLFSKDIRSMDDLFVHTLRDI